MSPALLLAAALAGGTCFRPAQFADLPVFEGTVTLAHGSFFGYIPPRDGDTCSIRWGDMLKHRAAMGFLRFKPSDARRKADRAAGGGSPPYIVLPAATFHVEKVHAVPMPRAGKLVHGFRLMAAESKDSKRTLTFDLDLHGPATTKSQPARLWVIERYADSVRSVAFIEGQFRGKLPKTWVQLSQPKP